MDSDNGQSSRNKERNWQVLLDKHSDLRRQIGLEPDGDIPDQFDWEQIRYQINALKVELGLKRPRFPCRVCGEVSFAVPDPICRGCALREIMASMTTDAFRRVKTRVRKYGIAIEDYALLHMAQKGVCAICHEAAEFGSLVVDHSHDSGRVRGLLCGRCNSGLGFFRDNQFYLDKAQKYLTRPPIQRIPEPENRDIKEYLIHLGT